jgi:pseudouridine synthase
LARLQKFLASSGICSRRAAEELIKQGRVRVNDRQVTELGIQIDPAKDTVHLDGIEVRVEQKRVYKFFKPKGVVSTLEDPFEKVNLSKFVSDLPVRVFPVGRLDKDAFGLLLLTNDGELSETLCHPRYEVSRVYWAEVVGKINSQQRKAALQGILLEDGPAAARVSTINSNVRTRELLGDVTEQNSIVEIEIKEGRKHLVKRLFAALGHPVTQLCRVSHGKYSLDDLKPGELREINLR